MRVKQGVGIEAGFGDDYAMLKVVYEVERFANLMLCT